MNSHDKKLYGTTTIGTKGQIVIPVAAREEMGMNTGDRLYVLGPLEKGVIVLMQEEKLEQMIETIDLHVEQLKDLKSKSK